MITKVWCIMYIFLLNRYLYRFMDYVFPSTEQTLRTSTIKPKILCHILLYYASYHTGYWDRLLQDSRAVLVYYSSERFLMSRCWPAIPLANREGSGSKSAGAAAEDLLFSFGWNHLLNVRPLILILPWDSSPWYEIPNRLRREPTAWPILHNVIQINLFKMLSGYLNG